jgi:tRNA pseudouridine55 synthase
VRRVGHAGTLDPFATGLLLVLVGRATRTQRFLMALPKTYRVTARLGATSTTGDPEGEVTETGVVPTALELSTGELRQRPPAFSAVKIDGERAYRRARRGESVEPPERTVVVHRFEQLWREGDRVGLEIECSAGTYVRSLVAALGDAYCEALRRTRIGPFVLPERDDETPIAVLDALAFLPERRLKGEEAKRAAHGAAVPGEAPDTVRLTDEHGLIALAQPRPDGTLKPIVGFRG